MKDKLAESIIKRELVNKTKEETRRERVDVIMNALDCGRVDAEYHLDRAIVDRRVKISGYCLLGLLGVGLAIPSLLPFMICIDVVLAFLLFFILL